MGDLYHKDFMVDKQETFLNELISFHAAVGTPLVRLPRISGHKDNLNLLSLYKTVTGLGGWEKVSDSDNWGKVAQKMGFPNACLNSSVALKQVYLRYLDKYEKMNFVKKVRGGIDDEVETNIVRLNRISARSLHNTPMVYKEEQHRVSAEQRFYFGLSTDLFTPSKYEKLLLSLISPLPNEQDFAINVCAMLSLNPKYHHVVRDCPKLMDYLLAHAAIFKDLVTRPFFIELYEKDRGHAICNFWSDLVTHDSLSWLADENYFKEEPDEETEVEFTPCSVPVDRGYLDKTPHDQYFLLRRAATVAKAFMNYTFDPLNVDFFLNDLTYIRFVILCCNAKFTCLSETGWSMFYNVASKFVLAKSRLSREILFLLSQSIISEDVSQVLASLKVLAELGKVRKNATLLFDFFTVDIYSRICEYLTVEDVVLLLHSLELLFSISYLNSAFCDALAHVNGLINILVLLLTFKPRNILNYEGAWQKIKLVDTIELDFSSPVPSSSDNQNPPVVFNHINIVNGGGGPSSMSSRSHSIIPPPVHNSFFSSSSPPALHPGAHPLISSTAMKLRNALLNKTQSSGSFSNGGDSFRMPTPKYNDFIRPLALNGGAPPNFSTQYLSQRLNYNGRQLIVGKSFPDSDPYASNGLTCFRNTNHNLDFVGFAQTKVKSDETSADVSPIQNPPPKKKVPVPAKRYLCEWRGCLRKFDSSTDVFSHICKSHVPITLKESQVNIKCKWSECEEPKCPFAAIMKHIFNAHCHPRIMKSIIKGPMKKIPSVPYRPPAPPPPQPPPPIYRPQIEVEDPISKSIKITAAVVIRNIALHSEPGRQLLLPHESKLAQIAFTSSDLSKFLAETLSYLRPAQPST